MPLHKSGQEDLRVMRTTVMVNDDMLVFYFGCHL